MKPEKIKKTEEVKEQINRPNYNKVWATHKSGHKIMYHDNKLKINQAMEGQTIEQKVERMQNNGESEQGGAELIYTERKDGIVPAYDIRTDRFETAIEAMTKSSASERAKREERHKPKEEPKTEEKTTGEETRG